MLGHQQHVVDRKARLKGFELFQPCLQQARMLTCARKQELRDQALWLLIANTV